MNQSIGINANWYDYGARFYDPAIGRFTTQDPLASEFTSWTPYHYVHNNPILLIDPTGMWADWFENEITGEVMNVKEEDNAPESEGEGWVNIGEDDMFGEDNIPEGEKGSITRMKTDESENFMNEQGFELVPKQLWVKDEGTISDIPIAGRYGAPTVKQIANTDRSWKVTKITYVSEGSKPKLSGIQQKNIPTSNKPDYNSERLINYEYNQSNSFLNRRRLKVPSILHPYISEFVFESPYPIKDILK